MFSSVDTRLLPLALVIVLVLRASTIIQPLYQTIAPQYRVQQQQLLLTELQVATYIREQPGAATALIFNNIFSPDSYLNNIFFRQAIVPQNDIVALGTYDRKVFDYSNLHDRLQKGDVRFIVINGVDTANGFLKTGRKDFVTRKTIGTYHILEHVHYAQTDSIK